MDVIARWTLKVCPVCGRERRLDRHCSGTISRPHEPADVTAIVVVPEADYRGAVDLLREIAESDAVDNALDPDRNRRIAAAYFAPSTTTRGQ